MENCLVKKLKGTVDNDNLLKLGESILCSVKAGTLGGLALFNPSDNPVSVRTANGGVFCNAQGTPLGVTSISLPKQVQTDVIIQAAAGDAPIIINDPTYATPVIWNIDSNGAIQPSNLTGDMTPFFKYRPLFNPSGNERDRAYNSLYLNIDNLCTLQTVHNYNGLIVINKVEGSINNLIKDSCPGLINIDLHGQRGVTGDLVSVIQNAPAMTAISLYQTSITCNIEDLAQFISTDVTRCFIGYGTNLSGSVETFCETMLSRLEGATKNIVLGVGYTAATFHGVALTTDNRDFKLEFGNGSITIKYNNSGETIATYNGSTWTYA